MTPFPWLLLAACVWSACAGATGETAGISPIVATARALPADAPPADRIGRIYRYLRSNRDGTEPEWIEVYRKDAATVEVYKMRARCENAALVVAELDLVRGQARRMQGGRLLPGNRREMFALLEYDPATHTIDAKVRLPARTLHDTLRVTAEPWHLYDFDLASLTVLLPRRADWRAPFSFGLPLVLLGDDPSKFLTDLGRADARLVATGMHLGRPAFEFEMSGPAFGSGAGALWIDRAEGHVLEARWPMPNHTGYRDFRLRLLGIDDGGPHAWDARLRAHFAGCAG